MKIRTLYIFVVLALSACKKTETVAPVPITPTPILSAEKAITTYTFTKANNSALSADVVATINESAKTITASVPYGTSVSALKATFSISAKASLKIGAVVQESGVTANNYAQSISLTVTAENNTTQNYTLTLSVSPPQVGSSNIVIKREEFAPGPPIQTIPTQTVDYTYNAAGLLTAFKDVGGNYTFDYDANGLLKTQTVKDNDGMVSNTFTYSLNANKLPTTISGTYGQTVETYTYAPNGQVSKCTRSYYGVIKDTYEYTHDGKNRIATVKYTSANEAAGLYAITTYQYYDDVYDPDPMIQVFIRPGIFGGVDPSTGIVYALKGYSYQKYNADGPINASQAAAYTYLKNTNGFVASLSDGNGGSLYKYTFK